MRQKDFIIQPLLFDLCQQVNFQRQWEFIFHKSHVGQMQKQDPAEDKGRIHDAISLILVGAVFMAMKGEGGLFF